MTVIPSSQRNKRKFQQYSSSQRFSNLKTSSFYKSSTSSQKLRKVDSSNSEENMFHSQIGNKNEEDNKNNMICSPKGKRESIIDSGEIKFFQQNHRELLNEMKGVKGRRKCRYCCCRNKAVKHKENKLIKSDIKTKELWIWLLHRIGLAVRVINVLKSVKKDIQVYGAMGESEATKFQRVRSTLILGQTKFNQCVRYIYIYIYILY